MRQIFLVPLILFVSGVVDAGEPVPKMLLMRLHTAGISEEVLIEEIQTSGVRFELTPAVRQELETAKLPAGVFSAIERAIAKRNQPSTASPTVSNQPEEEELPETPRKILELYRAGRTPEAFVAIQGALAKSPNDLWLLCAQGESALALRNSQIAADSASRLEKFPGSEDAVSCAKALREGIADFQLQDRFRKELTAKLRDNDTAGTRRMIDESVFAPGQKLILHHYVDRTQASFVSARARLQEFRRVMPAATATVQKMIAESDAEFRAYRELLTRVEKYLYSPFAMSNCTPEVARDWSTKHNIYLDEYLSVARLLLERYPDNAVTMDTELHALLLTAPYAAVKEHAVETMRRTGSLRIPFYSRERPFWLVIDGKNQRILTENHPAYTTNQGVVDGLASTQAFSVAFDQIRSVRQEFAVDLNVMALSAKTETVRLDATAMAPYPAFLHFLYCMYGEKAAREYAWKVGKLTAELIRPAPRSVSLIDPGKRSRDWLNTFGSITGYGLMGLTVAMDAADSANGGYGYQTRQDYMARQTLMQSATTLLETSAQTRMARSTAERFQDSDLKDLRARLSKRAMTTLQSTRTEDRLQFLERLLGI